MYDESTFDGLEWQDDEWRIYGSPGKDYDDWICHETGRKHEWALYSIGFPELGYACIRCGIDLDDMDG